MTLKNLLVASLATITLLTATGGGFAATGQAITDLNIREGAGSDYDIVGDISNARTAHERGFFVGNHPRDIRAELDHLHAVLEGWR